MRVQRAFPTCFTRKPSCFSDFKAIHDPTLGNCFTYNFNTSSDRMTYRAGAKHGLTVLLQGSQSQYTCISQTAGFKILIHNATEHPFADTQGYQIAPGTSMKIAIRKVYRTKRETHFETFDTFYIRIETSGEKNERV